MGHHIIMGRKTYESIGRPLPGRVNVVITRNSDFNAEGCILAGSLAEALRISKSDPEVFIFGGGEIFREALPHVSKIYMTKVHHSLEGDTYFPLLDPSHWKEIEKVEFKADEKNEYDYSFITLEKIQQKNLNIQHKKIPSGDGRDFLYGWHLIPNT